MIGSKKVNLSKEVFKIKVLRRLKHATFRLVLKLTVFQKRPLLLLFEKWVRNCLVSKVYANQPWFSPKKKFQDMVSDMAGNAILRLDRNGYLTQ